MKRLTPQNPEVFTHVNPSPTSWPGTTRTHADIVVFDAERISSTPMHMRHDLPGGAGRLYADAQGIDCVLCNGVTIVEHGAYTEQRPGLILRSGTDTIGSP